MRASSSRQQRGQPGRELVAPAGCGSRRRRRPGTSRRRAGPRRTRSGTRRGRCPARAGTSGHGRIEHGFDPRGVSSRRGGRCPALAPLEDERSASSTTSAGDDRADPLRPASRPAASIRSMGSASLLSTFLTPVVLAPRLRRRGVRAGRSRRGAGRRALRGRRSLHRTARLCLRLSANWPSSLLDTSAITPRPNCATLPVMLRSVSMFTVVPSPSGASVAVTVADALPWPRVSRPSAWSTTLRFASSASLDLAPRPCTAR